MNNIDRSRKRYEELFPDDSSKAEAFDRLAQKYYLCNFGTTPKADIDLLMFSIYLDRILDNSEEDIKMYSDYTLSKNLGITQNRISSLKEKKQLIYPYSGFVWEKSFLRISENARYENDKIKIQIPDRNLYLEIKNAIEEMGGYIDVQLNPSLLQISPEYFIELLMSISDEDDRKVFRKKLRKKFNEQKDDVEYFNSEPTSCVIKRQIKDIGIEAALNIVLSCIPGGTVAANILKTVIGAISNNF